MATDSRVMLQWWDYSHTSLWLPPLCSQAHPEGIWITLATETCFPQPQTQKRGYLTTEGGKELCVCVWGFAGHVRERYLVTYEEGNNKGKAAKMDVYEMGIRKHNEEKHLYYHQWPTWRICETYSGIKATWVSFNHISESKLSLSKKVSEKCNANLYLENV